MQLIKVANDLFIVCDKNTNTVLMLLDLNAAFDTADHCKLLGILHHEIGIQGEQKTKGHLNETPYFYKFQIIFRRYKM